MSRTTETKLSRKRGQIIESWRKFAPEETFANLTLAEFETQTEMPQTVRNRMRALKTELKGTMIERNKADEEANDLFVSVANSIRGNTAYGMNSPLYRSLGYVPKAERKRPQRKARSATPAVTPPAEADAA